MNKSIHIKAKGSGSHWKEIFRALKNVPLLWQWAPLTLILDIYIIGDARRVSLTLDFWHPYAKFLLCVFPIEVFWGVFLGLIFLYSFWFPKNWTGFTYLSLSYIFGSFWSSLKIITFDGMITLSILGWSHLISYRIQVIIPLSLRESVLIKTDFEAHGDLYWKAPFNFFKVPWVSLISLSS